MDIAERITEVTKDNRKILFWIVALVLFVWIAALVKEITVLLLLAYGFSLLIDPIVYWLRKYRVSRGLATLLVMLGVFILGGLFVLAAIPVVVRDYSSLINSIPDYAHNAVDRINEFSLKWTGKPFVEHKDEQVSALRERISAIGAEQLSSAAAVVGAGIFRGYSVVLTVVNFLLMPFFIYYISRDLPHIHRFILGLFSKSQRAQVREVSHEIISHVHSFFQGQIIVCLCLIVLYVTGLSVAQVPSGISIGVMAGTLSLIPYLGVSIGLLLSLFVTAVTDFTWVHVFKIFVVFGVVQCIEGLVLTPRIVGERVGIPPLGVVLALIIGGKLFGLVGIVLAIPGAAAARVLMNRLYAAASAES